jgi:isochorismate pyruvate lyase
MNVPTTPSALTPPAECVSIEEVRAAIDAIDHAVVASLGLRAQYVQAITRFKKTTQDVRAPERQAAVIRQRRAWAEENGLSPDVVEKIYRTLIDHFVAEELKALQLESDHS